MLGWKGNVSGPALWTMDLFGDSGKLPTSPSLSFPINCETEGWDVPGSSQTSSSRTLKCELTPAVVALPWLSGRAGPAGVRALLSAEHKGGAGALFGTPSLAVVSEPFLTLQHLVIR